MGLRTYRDRQIATEQDLQAASPEQLRGVASLLNAALSAATQGLWQLVRASRDVGSQALFDDAEALAQQMDALAARVKPTVLYQDEVSEVERCVLCGAPATLIYPSFAGTAVRGFCAQAPQCARVAPGIVR